MPCMGPSKDFAYEQADEIFEEILDLLKNRHHIERVIVPVALTPLDKLQQLLPGQAKYDSEWDDAKENLRKALRELVWIHECHGF